MKKDFNLTHLRYFRDAAQHGGVTKAAEKNFVTHSTVSQGIKKLEQDLGVELVAHQKRQFRLTDAGKSLLRECEKIFASLRHFERQIEFSQESPVGELVFGSSHSVMSAFILEALAKFNRQYAHVRTTFRMGKTPYVKEWLEDNAIDLGITLDDGNLSGLQKTVLASGKFILVKKKGAKEKDLKFLITEPRPETSLFQQQYSKKSKIPLSILMVVDSWELITKMAEHGLGIGLVPDFQISRRANPSLEVLDSGLSIGYELAAVARQEEQLSRNAQLFLDLLRKSL